MATRDATQERCLDRLLAMAVLTFGMLLVAMHLPSIFPAQHERCCLWALVRRVERGERDPYFTHPPTD